MILHTLKPRPDLRIVRWVRNQWLLLSFSTFNTKLAGAFPAELVESLQQSHRRGTLDRSAGALGQLPGRPGLPLARPSRSRSDTACRAPEVGGILLVPLGTLEEPCFSFHSGESSGQAAPSRQAASLSANLRGHREGSLQHSCSRGARLNVKLTLQGKAGKAHSIKGLEMLLRKRLGK